MPVSKRVRYEVLRRDGHTCRYCGAKAPDVQLTVDHVIPEALGGSDDPTNLVAACGDCNSGKSATSPDEPLVADVAADALRWSKALAEAAEERRAERASADAVVERFRSNWGAWVSADLLANDWRSSVAKFHALGLSGDDLVALTDEAMGSSVAGRYLFRSFCRRAWDEIAARQERARELLAEGDDGP